MIRIGKYISGFSTHSCQPKTKIELDKIIKSRISKEGPNCDLNDIDVSLIEDMASLFYGSPFNGDISKWNVSNVINMSYMFEESQFNGDISNWDVSKVKYMAEMFSGSNFNGDISRWNVSNVAIMSHMFSWSCYKNFLLCKTVNFASFAHISMRKF